MNPGPSDCKAKRLAITLWGRPPPCYEYGIKLQCSSKYPRTLERLSVLSTIKMNILTRVRNVLTNTIQLEVFDIVSGSLGGP